MVVEIAKFQARLILCLPLLHGKSVIFEGEMFIKVEIRSLLLMYLSNQESAGVPDDIVLVEKDSCVQLSHS